RNINMRLHFPTRRSSDLHPYTQVLLSAIPKPDPNTEKERERIIIEGDIPSPVEPPIGCPFRTRCPFATELCEEVPEWREIEEGRSKEHTSELQSRFDRVC